jgi:tetratricopeptide (TPR) repeat protein
MNMKKQLVFVFAIFLTGSFAFAQEGLKMLKEAKKEIGKYGNNAVTNAASLEKAMKLVEDAFNVSGTDATTEAWTIKGDIYNEIVDAEQKTKIFNAEFKSPMPEASVLAADAYIMGLTKVVKKGEGKNALKGLATLEQNIFNAGVVLYQDQNLKGAFTAFNKTIEVYNVLKANEMKSRLDDPIVREDSYYYATIAGYQAGMMKEIIPTLKAMYDNKTDKSFVYQVLYELTVESNPAEAEKYLTEGRAKFPEDTGLLFSEINAALKAGKLNELIGKLETAIEKEPDNLTVYTTLGSVYEQLSGKSIEAGKLDESKGYLDKAKEWYDKALAKDANNFEANYAIGALYYNNAAKVAKEVNEYANDFTPAGTKKYNEAKNRMVKAFEEALPFFEKAESINAKDQNTIIALKEIFARTGKLDKVKVYTEKLEALTAGN